MFPYNYHNNISNATQFPNPKSLFTSEIGVSGSSARGELNLTPLGALHDAENMLAHSKKLEENLQKLGLKIKHYEDNCAFLNDQMDKLDQLIFQLQGSLGKLHTSVTSQVDNHTYDSKQSEQNTVEQILRQEKTAAGVLCKLKSLHASPNLMTSDVLGIVATLGKVHDDNLSRLLAEYLGKETMLGIVCKTYDGVKALEKYDSDGKIDRTLGIHGLGCSIARPINGRFLAICLDQLRPYHGGTIAGDPQKKLDLVMPRLQTGECPSGFIGFAVNMIAIESKNLSCVTASGHGLRETLFYCLFSRLQVYRTSNEMRCALPCISEGAISLDGGLIKSNGIFVLGAREEVDVGFPLTSEFVDEPTEVVEAEEKFRLMFWEKERLIEDLQREQVLLQNAKLTFKQKKREFNRLLADSSLYRSNPAMSGDMENGAGRARSTTPQVYS